MELAKGIMKYFQRREGEVMMWKHVAGEPTKFPVEQITKSSRREEREKPPDEGGKPPTWKPWN